MCTKIKLFIALIAVLGFATYAAAEEECEKPWEVNLQADLFSAYMFRGQNLFDGASLQPLVAGSYDFEEFGSVGGYVWSHLSMDKSRSAEERFTEIDYNLYYSLSFEPVTAEIGLLWYTYPNGDDDIDNTEEWYIKIELDTFLSPTFTYIRDFDVYDANFYTLGFSHKLECDCLGEGFNITPAATFFFASDAETYYEDNGLESITVGVSSDMTLGEIAVVPSINYNFKIDETTKNQFWFGLTFQYDI